ncbi:MAG: tyrosine-type recombinase/integrase [Candidatus Thorarchaeota archaeon]|nr:tyrosine-type recombinase/integrase [Candidatus Thorarchaeota archaeon]
MSKRIKTNYPGVFYREARRIGGRGKERVYYIVFKKNGRVHEEKVGRQYADAMTPAQAAHMRSGRIEGKRLSPKELREAQERRRRAEANKWTLDRLWDYYRRQRGDYASVRTDKSNYKHLKRKFGDKEPKEIIQRDVDWLRLSLSRRKKPQTVKHVLQLLNRIINFGVNKGLCQGLNFKIEMPKVHNLKTEDLTRGQLRRLFEAIDKDEDIQAANILRMALFTGMRRGELFKLKWEDVDFERGFIQIRDPKGGPDQKIPLNNATREVLASHPRSDSSYIFFGRGGKQRTEMRAPVNRIRKRAKLPKGFRPFHGLRHVYASMLASSGKVDMYTLQKLLTHKSPHMTQRYAHLKDETLKRASDLAGSLVAEAVKGTKKKKIVRRDKDRDKQLSLFQG